MIVGMVRVIPAAVDGLAGHIINIRRRSEIRSIRPVSFELLQVHIHTPTIYMFDILIYICVFCQSIINY